MKKKFSQEEVYSLKQGFSLSSGIKIVNTLFQTATCEFYLGLIEEVDSIVLVKYFKYDYNNNPNDEVIIKKLIEDIDKVKEIENPNLIVYYDLEVKKAKNYAVILMEYCQDFITLNDYLKSYTNRKIPIGLPLNKTKKILYGILKGLIDLHERGIYHMDLTPENILVKNDLSEIKIINYAMRTHKIDSKKFPYYSSPEFLFENSSISYEEEGDIWSVGCILFHLNCGHRPYEKMEPFNAIYKIAQSIGPIEASSDDIKNVIYDRKNRVILDILNQCFRSEKTRPSAKDLLEHRLFKD